MAIKKPFLEKAIIRKGRATTNFFAEFSLINVYPPNFNPRKIVVVYYTTSFLSNTKWSDTPISTGPRRPGWYPRVSFRTIVHYSSVFRQTAAVSFFVEFRTTSEYHIKPKIYGHCPIQQWAWPQRTRSGSVLILNVSLDVVHELLALGSDFLDLAPIPGLSLPARSLAEIWDTVQTAYVSYFLKYPIVYHQIYF